MSNEDCDRKVIHGGEYQLVLISPELTCIGERCCEHKCTSNILWPFLLMIEAHCVSKCLVAMYLLSILGKCAIPACFKYYCIYMFLILFATLQEEISKTRRSVELDPTTCPHDHTHWGSYRLNPGQSHYHSRNGRPIHSSNITPQPNIAH